MSGNVTHRKYMLITCGKNGHVPKIYKDLLQLMSRIQHTMKTS